MHASAEGYQLTLRELMLLAVLLVAGGTRDSRMYDHPARPRIVGRHRGSHPLREDGARREAMVAELTRGDGVTPLAEHQITARVLGVGGVRGPGG